MKVWDYNPLQEEGATVYQDRHRLSCVRYCQQPEGREGAPFLFGLLEYRQQYFQGANTMEAKR